MVPLTPNLTGHGGAGASPHFGIFDRERALLHYDLFAISKLLPTVPRIRFSCILCTWFPLRRSDDKDTLFDGSLSIMGDVGSLGSLLLICLVFWHGLRALHCFCCKE